MKKDDEKSRKAEAAVEGLEYLENEEIFPDEIIDTETKDEAIEIETEIASDFEEISKIAERMQRTLAEFDNFRKRTVKEKSELYDLSTANILEKFLPVIDNFERAFDHKGDQSEDDFSLGMQMIYKQFIALLESCHVEEIKALGETFNHNIHFAVANEESEDYEKGDVMEVLQKGYKYKDKILRYAMVKVAD